MLEKYKDSQKIFYNYFMTSYDKKRISHAYLIETNNVSYSYSLAIDLAKFLLCDGVFDEKICDLIDSGNYPNLKIIGLGSDVKKGEIVSLKNDFSMKSIDERRLVYILTNTEMMNKSAANSLLKFLEEPEGDVIAILLCDKASNVLATISSRCQIINLISDSDDYKGIFASLYEKYEGDLDFDSFVLEKCSYFLDIYLDFEDRGTAVLANTDFYLLKDCFKEFLRFGYYMYFDVLNSLLDRENFYIPFVDFKEKIMKKNDINDIIYKIDVIDRFIYNSRYNVNINLFLDNFIISLGGDN